MEKDPTLLLTKASPDTMGHHGAFEVQVQGAPALKQLRDSCSNGRSRGNRLWLLPEVRQAGFPSRKLQNSQFCHQAELEWSVPT